MENLSDTITTIIAVYGALLATLGFIISLILGINELRKEKPKIKVTFSYGSLIDADLKSSESLILFEAHNTRLLPVIIMGCGWLAKNRKKYQLLTPYLLDLPQKLESRRKLTAYFACRWFSEYKNKDKIIGFYFSDEEGNNWHVKISKKQKLRIEKENNGGYLIEFDRITHKYYRKDK